MSLGGLQLLLPRYSKLVPKLATKKFDKGMEKRPNERFE
jgi:hypothetical protein